MVEILHVVVVIFQKDDFVAFFLRLWALWVWALHIRDPRKCKVVLQVFVNILSIVGVVIYIVVVKNTQALALVVICNGIVAVFTLIHKFVVFSRQL
jgi:hypothetical protein